MKFKCVILLILFAFLFIASANAEDNITVSDSNVSFDEEVFQENLSDIKVTFDEEVFQENLSDINVELPDECEGNFSVKINNEVIYNQIITNKSFKVPIILPKDKFHYITNIFPPLDCRQYKVDAYYNNIDLNLNKTLKVMKFPPDSDYFHFPKEVLQYDKLFLIGLPRSANGTVEFYIDDKLIEKTKAQPTFYWDKNNPFTNLALGNHTLKVIYSGDNYYNSFNRIYHFNVSNVLISIPNPINISHDDCISVETLKNIKGNVKVYIDDILVSNSKTEDGQFILSLEKYLKVDSKLIKVVYDNGKFSRTKTQSVNMVYDIDIFSPQFIYGEENIIEITLPDTLNNKLLTVEINNTKYSFTHPSYIMNNLVEVDVSKLYAGNYSMFVSFAGDGRFPAKNITYNFTVKYNIIVPGEITYKDSSKIYLNLPSDAKGNLIIYVDGKLFKKSKLNNGKAEESISSLDAGYHNVSIFYDGDDYEVSNINCTICIEPKVTVNYRFTASEDKYIILEVSKNSTGYVLFDVEGKIYKVNISEGIAKLSLSNLKSGEYEINVKYVGDDGFNNTHYPVVITVYKPKIKFIYAILSFSHIKVKIKVLNKKNKVMSNKKVTVIVSNKKFKIKTNKKGIVSLNKKIKIKGFKLKIIVKFMGAKVSKKVNIIRYLK